MAFSREQIEDDFLEASYLGEGPRDHFDLSFLLDQRRKLYQRKRFQKWIAKPGNKEKHREYVRRWRLNNPERWKEIQRNLTRKKHGFKARVPTKRGRPKGQLTGHPRASLTWDIVNEMRAKYSGITRKGGDISQPGLTYKAIGAKYGVGINAVFKVLNFQSWKLPKPTLSKTVSTELTSVQSKES